MDPFDPIEVLRATPAQVEGLVLDPRFSPEDREGDAVGAARPDARTLLARLTDREIEFAFRGREAVAATFRFEEAGRLPLPADTQGWGRSHGRMDPALAVAAFVGLRAWNLAWLARLDLVDWLAPCPLPGDATATVDDLVRRQAEHDVQTVQRLRATVTG